MGFRDPALITKDGEIIDGHIRVEAARRLGLKEIPCIIVEDLSEEEIRHPQDRIEPNTGTR